MTGGSGFQSTRTLDAWGWLLFPTLLCLLATIVQDIAFRFFTFSLPEVVWPLIPAFAWAVVPVILAWIGVLMPPYAGLVVLGVLLVVCYAVDRRAYRTQGAAAWLTLRFRATVVASLSCFVAAALS